MTLPAATVALLAVVPCRSIRPALVSVVVAAACAWPTTFGTITLAGPSETVNATPVPAPLRPGGGVWLRTMPAAVALFAVVMPTVRPAPLMTADAVACVLPTTFGTRVPTETTMFTGCRTDASVPAAGSG